MTKDIPNINNIKFTGEKNFKLLELWWSLLHTCNYRCDYCYAYDLITSKQSTEYYNKVWEHVLTRLEMNTIPGFKLEILGGEPALHPHFLDILSRLSKNKKMLECIWYTNFSKPVDFYKQAGEHQIWNDKQRLYGGFSYHPKSDNGKFADKCVELFKSGVAFYVNVNIINDEKYWERTARTARLLLNTGIVFELNFLQATKKYTGLKMGKKDADGYDHENRRIETEQIYRFIEKYNLDEYWEKYNKVESVTYIDDKDVEHKLDELQIRGNGLDDFYNKFTCPAWSWNISHLGRFTNVCTGEDMDLLFRNCGKQITCPVRTGCTCNSMFKYPKYRKS